MGAPLWPRRMTIWFSSSLGTRQSRHCWERSQTEEHDFSQKKTGFDSWNNTRFEYCEDSKKSLTNFRAIQGHSGGVTIAPELMEHILIPYDWKEFVFHRGCSFSMENGLIAGGKQSKEGRQTIFFTPLNPFGVNPDEEAPSDDFTIPRKVQYHSNWKHDQDAVNWVKLSRAQDQGLRFWQTKSRAIIVRNPMPADCIYRVISQNGGRTLSARLSTPRLAPKVTLRSNWQSQQQQRQSLVVCLPAPGNWMRSKTENGDVKGKPQRIQVLPVPGNWSGILCHLLTKSLNSKSIFEWKEYLEMPSWTTNKKLEKLKIGSCTKSFCNDLKKKGDMIFSKESSRVIYETDNLELIKLTQTSLETRTRGIEHVSMWRLAPTQSRYYEQNRVTFAALKTPYYRATIILSRGRKHGHNHWQKKDHAKAVDAKRGAKKRGDHPSQLSRWQNDEKHRASGGDRVE